MATFKTPKAKRPRISTFSTPRSDATAIEIPASPFMKKLGFGTAVSVYRMERSPKVGCIRSPWAIKRVIRRQSQKSRPSMGNEMSDRLCKEAEILKSLSHPNIVGFRAFTKSSDGRFTLAMEDGQRSLLSLIESRLEAVENVSMQCLNGSLHSSNSFDTIEPEMPFPSWAVLRVGSSLASALSYLHNEALLIHGDMKSDNVLVIGDFDAVKLCDFGVSLKVNKNGEALEEEQFIGTRHWLPPEVIELEWQEIEWEEGDDPLPKITTQADMYSYALTLWEMLSLKFPHCPTTEMEGDGSTDKKSEDSLEENLLLGTRPPFPEICLKNDDYKPVIELIHCCSDEDPSLRPTSKQATEWLEIIEKSGAMKKTIENKENVTNALNAESASE